MFSLFKKVSLRCKLIFFTLLLFIVVAIVQLGVTSFYFRTIIIDKSQEYFKATISQIGARIDTEINTCNRFASQITDNPAIAYYIDDIIHQRKSKEVLTPRVMAEVLRLKPEKIAYLRDIYIFPESGYPVNCYYSEVISETDPYSRLILNRLSNRADNKTIWDDFYMEQDYISSYSPLIAKGSVVGLVRIRYDKHVFGNIVDSANENSDNKILIVDKQGKIIYSNDSSLIGQSQNVLSLKNSFFIECPLNNDEWAVVGVISNASAFRQIAELNIIFLILNGIVLLFVLFAIIIYTNRVLRPLNSIVTGMKQIQKGNLNVTIQSDYSDEFGFIADNFNNMVYRINSLVNQICNYQIVSRQADMAALASKLNPHFLYNTLDTIYWILLMKDNVIEADMVVKLADILRYSISHQDDFVPLWEDMIQIENYIVLQKCRFNNKFAYSINIADDIKNIRIPKLFLQPLIENAFKHGFCDFTYTGFLEVSGFLKENNIFLIVKDNGVGIASEILPSIFSSGFGLKVTRDRITYAYGEEYGIDIHSQPGEGTEIILRIGKQPNMSFDHQST